MKAFIMAAGAGTRLRPLTYEIPKPMVPVVNKPVLEHLLENLKQHGIYEVVFEPSSLSCNCQKTFYGWLFSRFENKIFT
jgi:NDP-sugar pyrophosphorylase family protein